MPLISYQEFISIVLMALAVMLATLGVGIAILAIVGYAGLKKGLHEMARKHVVEAMAEKLKEYPSHAEIMETLQAQMIAKPASNVVESASNASVEESPTTSEEAGGSLGQPYPGEEPTDASDTKHN
jgi:hypothetical protein